MYRSTITILGLLSFQLSIYSQSDNGQVNWLTFEQAAEKNKISPRPYIIDLYTDWCGWCKHMMRTTYSNPGIAGYINNNFYPVKFNAETKDTIEYNGVTYKPLSPQPKTPHELTVKFLGNSLSYPSTMFVTNNYQYNLLSQGYLEEKKIEPLLVFMVENAWQTCPYNDFDSAFNRTFYDTSFKKADIRKTEFKEVETLLRKKKKKTLVFITADFCNTCKVMKATTFPDTAVGAYINKMFYFAEFNATRSDTITFKGEKHSTALVNNFPLHSLAVKLTNGQFTLPALAILDEDLNLLNVMNFYQPTTNILPVLRYFGSDAYKKSSFEDFAGRKNKAK